MRLFQKVLIIEDSNVFLNILTKLLADSYTVNGLSEATNAIEVCKEFQPDIVLLDIMLPGEMDGFSFLRTLKTIEKLAHIPVILISALAADDMIIEGLKLGANDYLVKPFSLQQLQLRIGNLIELSLKNRQNALIDEHIHFEIEDSHSTALTANLEKLLDNVIATDSDMTITEVAKNLNVSQSTLTRFIKEKFGLTPNNYIMKRKLEKAHILLQSGKGLTVKEVGFSLGFKSVSYFSKCYKKFYGNYPSESI